MRKIAIAVAVATLSAGMLGAGIGFAEKTHTPQAEAQKIRASVKYLSSNELEGRGTGQPGGDRAADWIADQFKKYGLKPAGENGTYFQSVPMVGVKTLPASTFELLISDYNSESLKLADDIVTDNQTQTESADVDAPIVFVGYGITAPEYQWDDYKGYDLKGKVALLFVNEPISTDPKFFKADALTYYGRWTYKFEETARRGAVATLIIHRSDLASYGWDVVRNSWGGERSALVLDGTPQLKAASWIQWDVARKLAKLCNQDLDKMFQAAQSRDFKPVELPARFKAHVASAVRSFSSRNVLAMLPGSDAQRNSQAVLYTAHYDHFGIDKAMAGNNIYHGAIDNGTGCGILLEMARLWGATKPAPPRSILFAAVTAEEQGLLGSEYLGRHLAHLPVEPVLDLNYDALAPIGIPEDVQVSGAERTTFYPQVEAISKKFDLSVRPDAEPGAGHYYRSDHFSLGRVGIPAFSIDEGQKFKGHDLAWGKAQAKDYVDNHYHKPTDEFRDDWDFAGLAKMTNFGYELGAAASSQADVIKWLPGDEFEAAQKKLHALTLDGTILFAERTDLHPVLLQGFTYPPLARQTEISGTVVSEVSVDADGTVKNINIVKGHPLLDREVLDTISKWKFEPQSGTKRAFTLKTVFELPEMEYRAHTWVESPLYVVVSIPPFQR
jgi:TonB family protein